jgi:hypothetical protein
MGRENRDLYLLAQQDCPHAQDAFAWMKQVDMIHLQVRFPVLRLLHQSLCPIKTSGDTGNSSLSEKTSRSADVFTWESIGLSFVESPWEEEFPEDVRNSSKSRQSISGADLYVFWKQDWCLNGQEGHPNDKNDDVFLESAFVDRCSPAN